MAESHVSGTIGLMMAERHISGTTRMMLTERHVSGTIDMKMAEGHASGMIGLMMAKRHVSGTIGLMLAKRHVSGTIGLMMAERHVSGTTGLMLTERHVSGTTGLMLAERHVSGTIDMKMAESHVLSTIGLMLLKSVHREHPLVCHTWLARTRFGHGWRACTDQYSGPSRVVPVVLATAGDLCLELSAASSFDLVTSFWTSSRRSFTRRSCTRNELVESDDRVSWSCGGCSIPRWGGNGFFRDNRRDLGPGLERTRFCRTRPSWRQGLPRPFLVGRGPLRLRR
ncbi:hypothetical protein BHM03_00043414, partial [Ensete ventricosum]